MTHLAWHRRLWIYDNKGWIRWKRCHFFNLIWYGSNRENEWWLPAQYNTEVLPGYARRGTGTLFLQILKLSRHAENFQGNLYFSIVDKSFSGLSNAEHIDLYNYVIFIVCVVFQLVQCWRFNMSRTDILFGHQPFFWPLTIPMPSSLTKLWFEA